MNEPNLDDLSILVPSKFSLVTLAMKRARQLKAGSRPLIDTYSQKPVTIALQEILEAVVRLGPQAPDDELEAEEQQAMLRAIGLSEPTSVSVTRRMEEIFGRDEDAEGEEYEDYEDYEDEEEREEDELETEKDAVETEDEEEEEIGPTASRRGADFLGDDAEEANEELEEQALEIELEDEEDEDEDEEESESAEAVEGDGEESAEDEQPKKGKASAAKTKAEKPAKAAKADDEAAPKKPGRKPKV